MNQHGIQGSKWSRRYGTCHSHHGNIQHKKPYHGFVITFDVSMPKF
jgi:hypothetical protein